MALAAGLPSSAAAAAEFPADQVRAEIARLVPPPWIVEEVTVAPMPAPAPEGKPAGKEGDSRVAARIGAKLKLAKPTYLIDAREGPFTFIRPATAPDLEKTLTATAVATRGATGWTARIELQNPEVMEGVGKPADELPGLTVLSGSDNARAAREQLDRDARQRVAEEQARRRREEELLAEQAATAKAESERLDAARKQVEARTAQVADLRVKLLGADRPARIAAYEAALGGNDPALRQMAAEAALQSRDPVLANLALKDWLARRKALPVQLYATKEDGNSETVLNNLGPLTLEVESFNPVTGALAGRLGAPGYSIAKPSAAVGALAQAELAVNGYGCALTLRLTEHRTMDGLFRCQTLPTLIARVTVD
ncbi:hypothetical protein [Azospirillum canadense]|uniref:hypothetical protein n=1 Tax=Azospirillum canadense TaxID=403962 RepID=UPI0022279D25|nr:hypothetical protein [Azospirillum canadense]MCW2235890.1 hypothetical protein [Azospirillum canadense]